MIILFTPYQTTTLLKWMFSQKIVFTSSLLLNGKCSIQVLYIRPPNNSDDLCLLFCLYPSSMVQAIPVCHSLTGVDVSREMVDFANKTYADETVSFHCMDIGTVSHNIMLTVQHNIMLIAQHNIMLIV